MAELYQVATGSKKISNLARIDGISGSAVIPVVMSNVVGSGYPITNGTTNQISYEDFRESVIENNANLFTQAQTIQLGSGNSQQLNTLAGFEFTMITGSGIGSVTTVAEGLKLEIFGQGANAGVKFFAFDNTDATPASRFKTFMELGTGNGNLNLTRNVLATGNLNVAGNLGLGGNLNINQNLVVGGTITAQSYNTEFISASIIYESGSTKFGDTTDDTHERTGSLLVSGSSAVVGNLSVSGIVQNALLGAVTSSLITQNISQNGVNLLLSAQTASQGLVNNLTQAVTSSLINIVGGIQSYTASLKSAAIVSSSQQIQNYNLFAVTSSGNTFYGNQQITGSLSVSSGQFNVMTGSGGLTSSLRFTHNITAPNDGNAILELRHNNRIYNDDIAIKLRADFAGAYIDYEEDTVPYSILSVQSFASKNIYIHQDTRLLFSNLTVDDNLFVKQNTQLTGSLIVVGGITGSILATNSVVSSSNQLVELNNQTGSQGSINSVIGIVTASLNAYTASGATSTSNINSFTASQLAVNTLTQAVTQSLIDQNTSQGLVNTLTSAVTSSLINQNTSQGAVNLAISGVTASLITQNTSQGLVNTLTSAVTTSLINQNTSQGLVNNLTQAVTSSLITIVGGLQSYTASLKGAAIVSSSTQIENYFLFAETASANTFYGAQTITGSLNVSGSTVQIGNNTLTGNTILSGSINVSGSTTFNGVHTLSGSNTIVGNTLMTGTNTIIGNTVMSGSIEVSGSSNFHNSIFIVTGSTYFTGSHDVKGNSTITGSLSVSGDLNVVSGSAFYRWGNKLFNYGVF